MAFQNAERLMCDNEANEAAKGVRKVKASERRQEIIDILVERGQVKYCELMEHFHVAFITIYRDVQELSFSYPIYTVAKRVGGGIYISEDYKPGHRYINDEETRVLKELLPKANEEQRKVLEKMIKKFSIKHRAI